MSDPLQPTSKKGWTPKDWTPNWWITKIISAFALFYLISALYFSYRSDSDKSNILKTEHIILFSIVLLFNSDLIEKLETFTFGDLSAKFASKEEVNKLDSQIDKMLLDIILDKYERDTLKKVDNRPPLIDDNYDINPAGETQLERLINRDLIEITGDRSFLKKHGENINLKKILCA